MKQREITPCVVCSKGMFHDGRPLAFTFKITREVPNIPAIRRQSGLEQVLGGNARIAEIMGPGEDMTVALGATAAGVVCMDCAMVTPLAVIVELVENATSETARDAGEAAQ